jgi:hypothetical protein
MMANRKVGTEMKKAGLIVRDAWQGGLSTKRDWEKGRVVTLAL